jgi:hypothetical protein
LEVGGGCGDRNPFNHHMGFGDKNFFSRHSLMVTKLHHRLMVMNKFSCHRMVGYDFGHNQWIKSIFVHHLKIVKWQPNCFWPFDGN